MKTQIRKTLFLCTVFLMGINTSAQIKEAPRKTPEWQSGKPFKNKLCNASNVHKNFKDIVAWVSQSNIGTEYSYLIQVTYVNPCREQGNAPTNYFTSWTIGGFRKLEDNCALSLRNTNVFFSDRNTFRGDTDKVSYVFDLKANAVEITLHTWGNAKTILRNLKRTKNTIYHVASDGAMIIFNLCPTKGPIIQ